MKKSIADEQKKIFGSKKEDLNHISLNLPYEISNQLILKTRENSSEIVEILKRNRIFNKSSVR
mgnify:CR=1 FL=1